MKNKLALLLIIMLGTAIFAQDLPRIAVYVAGDLGDNEQRALSASLLTALVRGGGVMSAERSAAFFAELESERAKLPDAAIDNDQISTIGKRFDIKYVCIANVTSAFGEFHISARVIDVETAANVHVGEAHSPLRSMSELTQTADELARSLRIRSAQPAQGVEAVQPSPALESRPSDDTPAEISMLQPDLTVQAAPTQTPPPSGGRSNIAVYVTSVGGGVAARTVTPIVARGITSALSAGGRFDVANRTDDIDRILGGAQLGAQQIQSIGSQLNIRYLCIVSVIFSGSNFGLEVRLVNTSTGATVTNINLANLNRNTVAAALLNIGRELLSGLGETRGGETRAAVVSEGGVRRHHKEEHSKHSIGLQMNFGVIGNSGDFAFVPESYFRLGLTPHSRIYFGGGWWPQSSYIEIGHGNSGYSSRVLEFSGSEFQLSCFFEWRTNNRVVNVYGGPGMVVGHYEYYYYIPIGYYSGSGIDFGAQGGMELKLGALVLGANIRPAVYTRFWNTGRVSGLTSDIGVTAGIAF